MTQRNRRPSAPQRAVALPRGDGGFTYETSGVQGLWYDFSSTWPDYAGPDRGPQTIPEPTSRLMAEFIDTLQAVRVEVTEQPVDPDESKEVALSRFNSIQAAQLERYSSQLAAAVAALCQDTPSAEEIEALPWRGQQAFFAYVTSGFFNPKAEASATKS